MAYVAYTIFRDSTKMFHSTQFSVFSNRRHWKSRGINSLARKLLSFGSNKNKHSTFQSPLFISNIIANAVGIKSAIQ